MSGSRAKPVRHQEDQQQADMHRGAMSRAQAPPSSSLPPRGFPHRTLANLSSELGDERPLATCAFRPDGSQLAVGSWSGAVKLWTMPECSHTSAFAAHSDRITGAPGLALQQAALYSAHHGCAPITALCMFPEAHAWGLPLNCVHPPGA